MVQIRVLDPIRGTSLEVSMRPASTFGELREAIGRQLGDGPVAAKFLERGRLAEQRAGALTRFPDDRAIADVRQVLAIGCSLEPIPNGDS